MISIKRLNPLDIEYPNTIYDGVYIRGVEKINELKSNKKEKKNMIVTIVGSLTKKREMDKIKTCWEQRGAVVNSPGDPEIQKMALIDIQSNWIQKIEHSDLVIAIPKNVTMIEKSESQYILEFGESTSYEMAIAKRFNIPIMVG